MATHHDGSSDGVQRAARVVADWHRPSRRPLIVGEAPNRTGDPSDPIAGQIGRRLADLAGLTLEEFAVVFERVNVLDAWPGAASSKGARFDVTPAVLDAASRIWMDRCVAGRTVLLLGRRVATAFCVKADYLEPVSYQPACTVVVVPHPSGINRWYNEASNRRRLRRFMRLACGAEVHDGQ